jgi:hypothetical protein
MFQGSLQTSMTCPSLRELEELHIATVLDRLPWAFDLYSIAPSSTRNGTLLVSVPLGVVRPKVAARELQLAPDSSRRFQQGRNSPPWKRNSR